jgi:tRNA pseudouridine55 synthase
MGRRRGRRISGWVLVDKPAGPTSTQVTGRVRRAFDAAKAGHAGTLDPAATGLLAVALGEATKTMPFVADGRKTYRFTVRWGVETTTDDAEGTAVATSAARPEPGAILAALPRFTGDIEQVPPAYSAVHVDGRRAHEIARGGGDLSLAPRPLHVARLALVDRPAPDRAILEMTCGKGGYVRSVARDLGRVLGCLGHVETLRRLRAGPFAVSDALPLEDVEADPEAALVPVEDALAGVRCLDLTPAEAERVRHGNPVDAAGPDAGSAWAAAEGRAVAVGMIAGGIFRPSRVLCP